ncbi:MAG: alpha/beta fold hydrolase [Candidatus Hodarchaeota archaeon]
MKDYVIRLKDGRNLAVTECGNPEGKPILYFHGIPGTRLDVCAIEESAKETGVRIIGLDRPGIGLSTFKPKRQIVDWPEDILELVTSLEIEQFSVIGFSSGSPYALICALKLPERVNVCGLLGAISPTFGKGGIFKFLYEAFIARVLFSIIHKKVKQGTDAMQKFLEKNIDKLSPAIIDQELFKKTENMDFALRMGFEYVRQGLKGALLDKMIILKDWGFTLGEGEISSKILLFHGKQDKNVPVSEGLKLEACVPGCKANYFPDYGHLSLFLNGAKVYLSSIAREIP